MIRFANALPLPLMLLCASALAAERLGSYPVDPAQVSVSGISSGAFMANQLPFLLEDVSFYADLVKTLAGKAAIDPPSNLARSRVYIFTGGSDSVVSSETVEKGRDVYAALGVPAPNIVFEDHSGPAAKAGHSWVTKNFGGKCSANKDPYINDCVYDQAGAELTAIYGPGLKPPAAAPSARIVAFDQTEFVPGGAARANGLSDAGYLYVPKDCKPGAQALCRLHIVLHGCQQSSEILGNEFMTRIGVNEWADANRIIVLYPQAHSTTVAELPAKAGMTALVDANPFGCWNWWGYGGDAQYLTKNGVQVSAIWAMVRRIEGR